MLQEKTSSEITLSSIGHWRTQLMTRRANYWTWRHGKKGAAKFTGDAECASIHSLCNGESWGFSEASPVHDHFSASTVIGKAHSQLLCIWSQVQEIDRHLDELWLATRKDTLEMVDVTVDVLLALDHTMDQHDQLIGIHRSSVARMIDDRKAHMKNATYHTCYMKRYYGQLVRAISKRVVKAELSCWNCLLALQLWIRRREISDLIMLLLISGSDPRNASLPAHLAKTDFGWTVPKNTCKVLDL